MIAFTGQVKVRNTPGHHIKVIEKMAEILDDNSIALIGNVMRKKRNLDLYSGGEYISKKEADEYCSFAGKIIDDVSRIVTGDM